uniref:Uncharacterized protein n=1 Tax=Planktothrix agardhii TaxID=1160 RepID=A0A1J1JD13_PLAAG|nr:protein of unknown function [Planktothrix agardhii]
MLYDVKISKGFTALKDSAYTTNANNYRNYRSSPPDKSNMSKYLFTGFSKCLYPEQKFQSEAERILALILERDAIKSLYNHYKILKANLLRCWI